MERLTTMHGGMMVPRKACTFDRDGGADDCKECTEICEDEGGVCHTCILQECLTRLGAYEDTGLTPEQIRELKERDAAKEAIITGYNRAIGCKVGKCPKCGGMTRDISEFCDECGQRLKWEE